MYINNLRLIYKENIFDTSWYNINTSDYKCVDTRITNIKNTKIKIENYLLLYR